jgi:hypothetical protein
MHSASSLFSFVNVEFSMNAAGMFSDNSVEIQSVRLEPYVLTSNYSDRVILACEVRFAPLMSCPLAHQHLLFPADRFNDLAWQILL